MEKLITAKSVENQLQKTNAMIVSMLRNWKGQIILFISFGSGSLNN